MPGKSYWIKVSFSRKSLADAAFFGVDCGGLAVAGVEDRVVRENQDAFLVPLSKAVRDELEQFIRNAELILPVLGHRTLECVVVNTEKRRKNKVQILAFAPFLRTF